MAAKPIKTMALCYPMSQFLIMCIAPQYKLGGWGGAKGLDRSSPTQAFSSFFSLFILILILLFFDHFVFTDATSFCIIEFIFLSFLTRIDVI